MNEALSSRNASVNVLREVITREQPVELAEAKILPELHERERRLSKAITATTLRHIGEISFIIDKFMKQPFDNDSLEKNIMRIGMAQLLFMDSIPPHAAIHGAVELAKARGKTRATGVINAVLRRTQREGADLLKKERAHILNIPQWIRDKVSHNYGSAKSEIIFKNMLKKANVDLRLRNNNLLKTENVGDLVEKINTGEETYRLKAKDIAVTDLPGWDDGDIYVQDAAAQIPARLLNNVSIEGPLLDMCAAPGGKTIQLLDSHKDREVTALDLSETRIKRIHENFKRCNVTAHIICGDASKTDFEDESFAGVLIDAPCSATGTSRRHPDVLVSRKPEHARNLVTIQKSILNEAARLVKKEGFIVYATCSLFMEEGEGQINDFLKENPNFERSPIALSEVGENMRLTNKDGEVRTTPAENLDGFFAARLQRKG